MDLLESYFFSDLTPASKKGRRTRPLSRHKKSPDTRSKKQAHTRMAKASRRKNRK